MKFLFSWLKEFTEVSVHPQALADRLTAVGLEVTNLVQLDGDWLFEAEVTPNRPDCLSVLGVAREAAVALGRPFRFPRWLKREFQLPRGVETGAGPVPVTLEETDGCQRYVGIVIEGIQVGPSPADLASRLERLGIRPVNSVVDVTNLCLLEMGQPLHAFDLDAMAGPEIRVRRASAREELVTLDGQKRTLQVQDRTGRPFRPLVIADSDRPVALAGMMGGLESQITGSTRRLFLESAWFDPRLVRKASILLKITTESSYRFERGVELEQVGSAAIRAARWIVKLGGGRIVSLTDVGVGEAPRPGIPFRPRRIREVLGLRALPSQQRRVLEHLGCRVRVAGRGWRVEPPSWRQDLKIQEDLQEEVARLMGYDRCETTLPAQPRRRLEVRWLPTEDPAVGRKHLIRRILAGAGLQEILTYSLVRSGDALLISGSGSGLDPRQIWNPLSAEQAYLRPGLLAGALQTAARNFNRKSANAPALFELGTIYLPKGAEPDPAPAPGKTVAFEREALSILLAGTPEPVWGEPVRPLDLFDLKGMIHLLLRRLELPEAEEKLAQQPPPGAAALTPPVVEFHLRGTRIGWAGGVAPRVLESFDIPKGTEAVYAELDLEMLLSMAPEPLQVEPLPKIPPLSRDLAVVVSEEVLHGALSEAIRSAGRPLLTGVSLFDLYRGKQVPPGKKSLAFRLNFSAGDRTLTDAEVTAALETILSRLKADFQATLRG